MSGLKVCQATSELYPFSKAGGLADVSSALSRYLALEGHDVRVFSPLYATLDTERFKVAPVDFLQEIPVDLSGTTYWFSAYTALQPGTDLWVYFIHCPQLYDRPTIYTDDLDEHRRFILLSHAVLQCCQRMGWSPDVIHSHDWPTALLPLIQSSIYRWDHLFRNTKSVLTIHNIGYQGVFSSNIHSDVVPWYFHHLLHQDDFAAGMINFLKTGLLYADILTTVSPTYAKEIQTPTFGAGLNGTLAARHLDLAGILNGVDYNEWSPSRDPFIENHYSARNVVSGKRLNKKVLLEKLGLPFREKTPVAGVVSRLVEQKGFELLFDSFPELLEQRDLQFVAVGTGERKYVEFFVGLQERFPEKVAFFGGYSDEIARLVEAGADLFLMPSKYEPCGLSQMYSLKYGTVPVVRWTGGLADTVQHYDPVTGEGTGFVFEHYTSAGLTWAMNTALDLFPDRKQWLNLMRNGMRQDFSWARQITKYVQLYQELMEKPTN
jgi:starch synthase